jgi:hypothetical protein
MKGWNTSPQPLGFLSGTKPGRRRRLGKHSIEIGNRAGEIWDHGEEDAMEAKRSPHNRQTAKTGNRYPYKKLSGG